MDTLTGDILDKLKIPNQSITQYLEPTKIDVKRLRDDRSDIQAGDEVAFVATVAFRVTKDGRDKIAVNGDTGLKDLAAGDTLFGIAADGELLSVGLPLDAGSVATWIAENFAFEFLLNDAPSHAFGPVSRNKLAQPWIQKLNTAAVKHDYIDVDVRITEHRSTGSLPPPPPESFELGQGVYAVDATTQVIATMTLQTSAATKLVGRTLHVPLEGCGEDARLLLTFVQHVTEQKPTQPKHK